MVEARKKYYTTRSQGINSSKLLLLMLSSTLLLVLKAQQIDSALLVWDITSSRAKCAASSFTNKALRSSSLGSSVEARTTSTQEHPTHSLGSRKYPQ